MQGMSETFSTLHGLVNKGVNVVMDIPFELWNETSAEVADLKKQVGALTVAKVMEKLHEILSGSKRHVSFVCVCVSV